MVEEVVLTLLWKIKTLDFHLLQILCLIFLVVDIKECFNSFLSYVAGWLFNICFYNARTLWKNPLADQKCRFVLDVFIVSEDRNIYRWSSVIFIIMNNNEKDKEIDQINPGKSWDEKCEWTFLMLFLRTN